MDELFKYDKDDPTYMVEGVLINITEHITELMHEQKIKNTELAKKIGVHPSTFRNWLKGSHSMTIFDICRVFAALGHEPVFSVKKTDEPQNIT